MDIAEAVKLHDDLLATKPDGARHDSDTCSFCVDKATQSKSTASAIPPAGDSGPDVSDDQHKSPTNTEGGTPEPMDTISKETHEALLSKAVADAVAATEQALEKAKADNQELTGKVEKLSAEHASLTADNDRLNKELDSAQVNLKAAQDEVSSLKADIAKAQEEAAKREIASKRADQAKNLGLFTEEYVTEKASSWASLTDDQWNERVDEWSKLAPKKADDSASKTTDTASAMTGTSGNLTETPDDKASENTKPRAGRAVLGLS